MAYILLEKRATHRTRRNILQHPRPTVLEAMEVLRCNLTSEELALFSSVFDDPPTRMRDTTDPDADLYLFDHFEQDEESLNRSCMKKTLEKLKQGLEQLEELAGI